MIVYVLALALVGLANGLVVTVGFAKMAKEHAKERQFLINAALSNTTYDFAVRQAATTDKPSPVGQEPEEIIPEGL